MDGWGVWLVWVGCLVIHQWMDEEFGGGLMDGWMRCLISLGRVFGDTPMDGWGVWWWMDGWGVWLVWVGCLVIHQWMDEEFGGGLMDGWMRCLIGLGMVFGDAPMDGRGVWWWIDEWMDGWGVWLVWVWCLVMHQWMDEEFGGGLMDGWMRCLIGLEGQMDG